MQPQDRWSQLSTDGIYQTDTIAIFWCRVPMQILDNAISIVTFDFISRDEAMVNGAAFSYCRQ